jgi:hypothetical protein
MLAAEPAESLLSRDDMTFVRRFERTADRRVVVALSATARKRSLVDAAPINAAT